MDVGSDESSAPLGDLEAGEAADHDVLAKRRDGRGDRVLEENPGGTGGLKQGRYVVGVGGGDFRGDLLDELGEDVVLGDEVGLAIDLD